eukprot:GHRR01031068.1.p1 GENE.GHRR01031068.1~~GHRR01031068.1.p1  ORF type:complete len:110 (+),score=18.57 GHRR01031068.1:241-570(+)
MGWAHAVRCPASGQAPASALPAAVLSLLQCTTCVQVIGTTYRTRYYFAWGLGHCSLALAGLDFWKWDPATGAGVWGRCKNAQPLKVEFCDSSRLLAGYWNTSTGIFLRR